MVSRYFYYYYPFTLRLKCVRFIVAYCNLSSLSLHSIGIEFVWGKNTFILTWAEKGRMSFAANN